VRSRPGPRTAKTRDEEEARKMTVVISIGRNIGDEPMSTYSWDGFRGAVRALVDAYAGPVVFAGTGEGIYDGLEEEAFTVIGAESTENIGTRAKDLQTLKSELRSLAGDYRQDSIAWTRGTTLFLKGV